MMHRTATLSPCGLYRYHLVRRWADEPQALFILLNPSTADAEIDDPTVRRCMAFARSWGRGAIEIVNLFALRSPNPAVLEAAPDPVGPENDTAILAAARRSTIIVCGWGVNGALRGRDTEVYRLLLGRELHCLGRTAAGHPKHPLYLARSTQPIPLAEAVA